MGLDSRKVYLGLADQTPTTGAISAGPAIDADDIPATIDDALTLIEDMESSGYVSEDGLSLSQEYNTNDIREWNGATVRTVLESFNGTLAWSAIQIDADSAKQAYGANNVAVTPADADNGEQLRIGIGTHLPPVQSWGFRMKDGDARLVVFVPRGQVTAIDSISFTATDPVAFANTLTCYDDGTGNSIYLFVDDGQTTGSE